MLLKQKSHRLPLCQPAWFFYKHNEVYCIIMSTHVQVVPIYMCNSFWINEVLFINSTIMPLITSQSHHNSLTSTVPMWWLSSFNSTVYEAHASYVRNRMDRKNIGYLTTLYQLQWLAMNITWKSMYGGEFIRFRQWDLNSADYYVLTDASVTGDSRKVKD
jgi:hypothetical protein